MPVLALEVLALLGAASSTGAATGVRRRAVQSPLSLALGVPALLGDAKSMVAATNARRRAVPSPL